MMPSASSRVNLVISLKCNFACDGRVLRLEVRGASICLWLAPWWANNIISFFIFYSSCHSMTDCPRLAGYAFYGCNAGGWLLICRPSSVMSHQYKPNHRKRVNEDIATARRVIIRFIPAPVSFRRRNKTSEKMKAHHFTGTVAEAAGDGLVLVR